MSTTSTVELHRLPIKTLFRGTTDTQHFTSRIEPFTATCAFHRQQAADADSSTPLLQSSFRGRRLIGQRVTIPDGYKGYCAIFPTKEEAALESCVAAVGQKRPRSEEDEPSDSNNKENESVAIARERYQRKPVVLGEFFSYTLWEHDRPPPKTSGTQLLQSWTALSKVIHAGACSSSLTQQDQTPQKQIGKC